MQNREMGGHRGKKVGERTQGIKKKDHEYGDMKGTDVRVFCPREERPTASYKRGKKKKPTERGRVLGLR